MSIESMTWMSVPSVALTIIIGRSMRHASSSSPPA